MKKLIMATVFLGATAGLCGAKASNAIRFSELDVDRDDALTMTEAGLLPKFTRQWRVLDRTVTAG